jgi:TM2 domain-containing membrane protein YozV
MNTDQTATTLPSAGSESAFRIPRVAILAFYFGIFGVHRFYTRRPILGILQLITLGVHRFYAGKIGTGLLQLVTLGGLGIWTLVDHIMISWGTFTDGNGERITRWT